MINFNYGNSAFSPQNTRPENNSKRTFNSSKLSNASQTLPAKRLSFGHELPSVPAKVKLFIFDFDGTLGNTLPMHFKAWQRVAEFVKSVTGDLRYCLTEVDRKIIPGFNKRGTIDHILGKGDRNFTEVEKKAFEAKKAEFSKDILNETPKSQLLTPGANDFVEILSNLGFKKVVATVSSGAKDVMKKAGLDKHFNKNNLKHPTLIDAKDKGILFAQSKPDPGIFLAAAKAHNVKPSECVVFEDSKEGFAAAKGAGMPCIAIGDTPEGENPIFYRSKDFNGIISNFDKLIDTGSSQKLALSA